MNTLLRLFLEKYMQLGQLTVISARGEEVRLGDGSGPPITLRFNTARAERAVAANPALRLGECFMGGEIDMLRGSIYDLIMLGYANAGRGLMPAVWMKAFERMRIVARRLHQINTRVQARGNVRRHYDLSADLYRLFLDPDMQYSCAYYPRPDIALAQAQLLKKRHIAAKLRLEPGVEVLDIGCGWGGMGLHPAYDAALRAHRDRWPGPVAEAEARWFVESAALLLTASVLLRRAPAALAEGYAASRLTPGRGRFYGALPAGQAGDLLDLCFPE